MIRKRDKTGSSRKKVKYIFTFDYFETKLLIHVMMMLLCYCFVVVIVAKPHEIKFFFYIKKESQFHPQRNAAQLLSPIVKLKKKNWRKTILQFCVLSILKMKKMLEEFHLPNKMWLKWNLLHFDAFWCVLIRFDRSNNIWPEKDVRSKQTREHHLVQSLGSTTTTMYAIGDPFGK